MGRCCFIELLVYLCILFEDLRIWGFLCNLPCLVTGQCFLNKVLAFEHAYFVLVQSWWAV